MTCFRRVPTPMIWMGVDVISSMRSRYGRALAGRSSRFRTSAGGRLPPGKDLVDGLDLGQEPVSAGNSVSPLSGPVGCGDGQFRHGIQDVHLRQGDTREAVDPGRVPAQNPVEPTTSSRPARGSPEFRPKVLIFSSISGEKAVGKGPFPTLVV